MIRLLRRCTLAFSACIAASLALSASNAPAARPEGSAQQASFAPCGSGPRITCVVDGDTFWLRGRKIRIADINTPETGSPHCPAEARLGEQASLRLTQLLNQGPFTLEPVARDTDRYGRLLRVVRRNGASLGAVLVREGLAERWKGYRGNWC